MPPRFGKFKDRLTRAPIGVIDDFYDRDFAKVPSLSNRGASASTLLSAAESAFARRGFKAALAVCPAAWTSKVSLLEREGYQKAKLWMLKRNAAQET